MYFLLLQLFVIFETVGNQSTSLRDYQEAKKKSSPYLEKWQYIIAAFAVVATLFIGSSHWYSDIVSDKKSVSQKSFGDCSPPVIGSGVNVTVSC